MNQYTIKSQIDGRVYYDVECFEDNGGGLHLAVLSRGTNKCRAIFSGFECFGCDAHIITEMAEAACGKWKTWDGNFADSEHVDRYRDVDGQEKERKITLQEAYEELADAPVQHVKLVAETRGKEIHLYPYRMGHAASIWADLYEYEKVWIDNGDGRTGGDSLIQRGEKYQVWVGGGYQPDLWWDTVDEAVRAAYPDEYVEFALSEDPIEEKNHYGWFEPANTPKAFVWCQR